jgi:hypothetical protein
VMKPPVILVTVLLIVSTVVAVFVFLFLESKHNAFTVSTRLSCLPLVVRPVK